MIVGRMVGLQARVDVTFRLPNQPDFAHEFVVDTGFEGALTLPPAVVATLGLPFHQDIDAALADGNSVRADVYRATIVWQGQVLNAAVLAMGMRPLLGAALLDGNELFAQFKPNGAVRINDAAQR